LYFNIRETKSKELVRCDAADDLYDEVHQAMERRGALLYVRGSISVRRIDKAITAVKASAIRVAPPLTDREYERFFGLDPNYTGSQTTEEFIDDARGYDH
jgi:hypothetical protein